MTGLEWMTAIAKGEIPQAPISKTLAFEIVEASEGRTVFVGHPSAAVENPMGGVHGGWAMTLLDSALGAAVMTTLDEKTGYGTVQINVNLVRPITKDTGPVRAEGRVVHRGKMIATASAELTDGAGKLLAHATATCALGPR